MKRLIRTRHACLTAIFTLYSTMLWGADLTYSGHIATAAVLSDFSSRASKEFYELFSIESEMWAEFNGVNGSQFAAEFESRLTRTIPLQYKLFQVRNAENDTDLLEGFTDINGNFSFTISGDISAILSFVLEDTSGRRMVDEHGRLITYETVITAASTSLEYLIRSPEYPDFAAGNLLFDQLDDISRLLGQSEPHINPDTLSSFRSGLRPNVVYGATESSAGNFAGYAYDVQFMRSAPFDQIVPSPYGAIYHEPFHYMLSRLYGAMDYRSSAVEQTTASDHVIGGDLGSGHYKMAFDESFAHFGAGVGVGIPIGGIYHLYYMDYCSMKAYIEYVEKYRDVSTLQDKVKNTLFRMKQQKDRLLQRRNEIAELDLNRVEGYATEYFNELYFNQFGKTSEALAKIMNVLHNNHDYQISSFLETWKQMYPEDAGTLEQTVEAVRVAVEDRPEEVAAQWEEEIAAYEDRLFGMELPPPPLPSDTISYVPGGMAKCPGRDVFLVTDNTRGRVLLITKNASFREYHTLLEGLNQPGDIDIGDMGRSFVVAEEDGVRKYWFGLSGRIYDEDRRPVSGATVFIQTAAEDRIANTDGDGYFDVLGLQQPTASDNIVTMTVTFSGKSQQYTVLLRSDCQTCEEFEFAQEVAPPEGEGEDETEGEPVIEGEVLEGEAVTEGEVEGEVVIEGEQAIEGEATGEGEMIEGEVVPEGEALVYYELFLSVSGNGSTSPSVEGSPWSYLESSLVSLTATPAEGWRFDHWEGDIEGTDNPVDILMNGPKNVVAVFVEDNKSASVSKRRGASKTGQALTGE